MPLYFGASRRHTNIIRRSRRGFCLFVCASIFSTVTAVRGHSPLHPLQRLVLDGRKAEEDDGRKGVHVSDDSRGRAISLAETYREGHIWFGMLTMEYALNASATLSLAFKTKVHYVYTAPFMTPFFQSNPWLRYRTVDFGEKQRIVRTIQRIASGRSWLFRRNPVAKVTSLFVEMLMSKISTCQQRALSTERKKELAMFITESHAAASANALSSPIATVKNVVEHAFQNGLRGLAGIAEWELNQGCFAIAHRIRQIMPFTNVFPGGIIGRIMLKMTRSFLVYFHPNLVIYKGIVAASLALLCQLDLPKVVNAILSRIYRARRRLGRAISSLWRKYVGMRRDVTGNILIEDMVRGGGVVMITLLFQLHGVDVDSIARQGEAVEAAMVAGQGAWAFSDGLFVGAKDFAQLFKAYFTKYVSMTTGISQFCKDREAVSPETQEELNNFFSGQDTGDLPPGHHLLEWCSTNASYIKQLETNSLRMAQKYLQYMVKTLQRHFTAFEEYLSNLTSILYEHVFASLESDVSSTINDSYGRPAFKGELEALLKRQQQTASRTQKSEIARGLFRKPWMAKAIRNLADGFFNAAAALTLLNHLKAASASYKEAELAAARSRGYKWLLLAAKQIRAALAIIYGRFLNSQAIITRAKNLKTRMRVYDFITRCQDGDDPDHASMCGNYVTTAIDEMKFVGKSLLVLNVGVAGDPKDLTLTTVLAEPPSFDPTATLAGWHQWMVERGFSRTRHAELLGCAEDVNSKEKVEQFMKVLAIALQERLRFFRYEVEGSTSIRLFDMNGRTAVFTPQSSAAMYEQLKQIKPDPLDAPSVFRVTQLHAGELIFTQAPNTPLQGHLMYSDERRELIALQHDPIAAKELLVSQLMGVKGRLGAEMVATLLMALHRRIVSFNQHSLLTFLNLITPKMFMDGITVLTDAAEMGDGGVVLEQGLYIFPQSFETLKDIFFGSMDTTLARMYALDFSDSLAVFVAGILHQAYHKIQKFRTGRTKVLERFQQALLHVVEAAEVGALDATFPECSFLGRSNEADELVRPLRCAIYRFMKLRSLDIGKAAVKDMDARRAILYVNAAVEYLDSLRGVTPWKEFLNYEDLRGSAPQYAETVGRYSFEDLQAQISGHLPEDGDLLEGLRDLMHPALGKLVNPGSTEGAAQVVRTLISGIRHLGSKARSRVKTALKKLTRKMKTLLSHRKLPKKLRRYNVVSGGQFFGALEHAERQAFPESGQLPSDFIRTTDLAAFGRLLLSLERTGLFLENPKAMSAIVTEMRTIPFVTPETEQLYHEIQDKINTMARADVRAAAGYILTYNIAQGSAGVNVALALLALKGFRFATRKITHLEKVGILKVLDPETLRFIRRSLELPLILRHMKAIPEAEALTLFRFRPRGSISFAYPATSRTLPLNEKVEVAVGLDRIYGTGLLQALTSEMQARDEEHGCLTLFGNIQRILKVDFAKALKLWSQEPGTYDKRMTASCAVLLILKEMLNSGERTTTVRTLLERLYFDGTPVIKYVEYVASTRANEADRMKQLNMVNPVVATVYVVSGGGLDSLWTNFIPETGHLHFQSRPAGRISDETLYDLFIHTTEYIMESTGSRPQFYLLELESYFLEEWFRFLEPARVEQYVKTYNDSEGNGNIDRLALKHLSSVYVYYDVGDYYMSLRQRSVVPVADVVKSAANGILNQQERTLSTYGIAMLMLDMSKEIREAKIECYGQALKQYKEYTRKNREAQEMWKIDCVHRYLIDKGSLGYSAAALNEEEKDAALTALDNEFKVRAQTLYNALVSSEVDVDKLKKQVWTFITMPHISLRSSARLKENVRLAHHFITSVRQHVEWEVLASDLASRRANKTLCRSADAGNHYMYSYVERPFLFNPFQLVLDLLVFIKTNKAQSLRLPKVLLMRRLQLLPRLLLLRKTTPPAETLYAKELQLGQELLSQA